MKAGFVVVGFALVTLTAQAQTIDPRTGVPIAEWTIDDYNAGKIAIDPALGWSPQDAVNWYNRYRPKPSQPTPTPQPQAPPAITTTTRPEGCQNFSGYAISDEMLARCITRTTLLSPWTREPYAVVVGEVYRDTYMDRVLVLSVAADIGTTRRIVTVRLIRASDTSHLGELRAVYEDVFPWFPLMPGEAK